MSDEQNQRTDDDQEARRFKENAISIEQLKDTEDGKSDELQSQPERVKVIHLDTDGSRKQLDGQAVIVRDAKG